jgi:branched-chain amino acid transport system ATP-binding protein
MLIWATAMVAENLPLKVSGLTARYGIVPAINAVDLELRTGQIVTIIGANGAGKSTLIKTICGLVRPVAGKVYLFGEDVTGLSPDKLVTRGLSVVPEGRRLFGEMTLLENLEMGAFARSDKKRVQQDLERCACADERTESADAGRTDHWAGTGNCGSNRGAGGHHRG